MSSPASPPKKLAYCSTVKDRTMHLEKTLPANLANNKDPRSIFVILNYNSGDHLLDYLITRHKPEMKSGKIVLYTYGEPVPFHMSHAKCMAARLAIREGADLLCTLDADNFAGKEFDKWTFKAFEQPGNYFFGSGIVKSNQAKLPRGVAGRLLMRSQDFLKLGGYDEKYDTWRGEDMDLNARARRMGMEQRAIDHFFLDAVWHGPDIRFKEWPYAKNYENDNEVEIINRGTNTVANYGNFGCGTVLRNFDPTPVTLGPVPTRIFGIGFQKTATTSLNKAFQILGYDSGHWVSNEWAENVWREMHRWGRSNSLERYYALCDNPIPLLYKALDKAYPGSKFVLTVRPDGEWADSVERHWGKYYGAKEGWGAFVPFSHQIHRAAYGRETFDRETFLAAYHRHNAGVQDYFRDRREDLCVLHVQKGSDTRWDRLCAFLGVPEPSVSFPREFVSKEA